MFKSVFKSGIRANYSVLENASFVSEPWYAYPAKHKVSGQLVSVFIFDKTKFESQVQRICNTTSNTKNPRMIAGECCELLKFEVSQLAKLKHPQILTIIEPLEETKLKMLFVTEAVTDSLMTVNIRKQLDDLSIQKGLLHVAKGLQFLHDLCQIVHLNIQPSSIFINNQGDWKLAGFRFTQNLNEVSPSERDNFYIMNNLSVVPFSNLNVNFTAPELIVDTQLKLDIANDVWSFGCLIYYLYNNGECLINCFDQNSISDYKIEFRKFESKFYNHRVPDLKYILKDIPERLAPVFQLLMARYPHDRMSMDEFLDSSFFEGSLIKAMWFVDEFTTKTAEEKLVFIKGLLSDTMTHNNLLDEFPTSFKTSKLLPVLIDLVISELNMAANKTIAEDIDELVSTSLDIILKIGSGLSGLTFQDKIYDTLLKGSTKARKGRISTFSILINASVRIRLTLVQNIAVLSSKLKDSQLVSLIKESAQLFLTSAPTEASQREHQIQLQESFLSQLPSIVGQLDFPYIKNDLFPLVCTVFKTTTILSTKLASIEAFQQFVKGKVIDTAIVREQLLPVLQNLKSRDKRIVSKMIQLFVEIDASDCIPLDLEESVGLVLQECFKLAFCCDNCSKGEFKEFMKQIAVIQTRLTNSKLNLLPETSSDAGGRQGPINFDSLVQNQPINRGKSEELLKAPHTDHILQPSRPGSSPANRPSQQSSQQPSQQRWQQPSLVPKPKVQESKPLTLKPKPPTKTRATLSFGAADAKSNQINSKLLDSLQSTFQRSQPDEEDFQEFQEFQQSPNFQNQKFTDAPSTHSNNQPSASYYALTVLQPTNNHQSTSSSHSTVSQPNYNLLPTPAVKPPPGFNSNMVLSPKTRSNDTTTILSNQSHSNPVDLI